ncbi:FAD-dependent oxidoreductase [Alkalicoccobacillus plakortidis]|uniref:FAD-dependent oxidoreductase n=1 Tax=Alkalicoccobacillus plakortidis TaxID=444060 RepID=A0ABT0XP09_9BACI|nr:FAD-dependent oxidoreductase [Alkalicoccobacillus plakortidis]MCM2677634.1 FAD-dependent oxidoreductase [Alkalicoccobacillus plakortidis]
MGLLKDVFSIFKKSELTYKRKIEESDDIFTFYFDKPKDLDWQAGQHGLFTITHQKIKNGTRPFTIATSPAEDELSITTKLTGELSAFKQSLSELETGMKINMSGPVGSFYLKDSNPALLIAGGVGITPYRAILKQIENEGLNNREIKLLYISKPEETIYKEELTDLSTRLSVSVEFITEKSNLYPLIDQFSALHINNGQYYIAGSKPFVESVTNHIKGKGIRKAQIHKDTFLGYN